MKLIVCLSLFPSQEHGIHVVLLAILPVVEYVFKSFIVVINQYKLACMCFSFYRENQEMSSLILHKIDCYQRTFNSKKNQALFEIQAR
jgi:hypothetical protein